ncbi:MAG: Crp/Fnr family transcriptional regulator [Caldilineaceae bacterium]
MNQHLPQVDPFSQQLQAALREATRQCSAIKVAKGANIYTLGEPGNTVYFIESGQIKLVMLTPDGRECLLAILTDGDICGEGCLAGLSERQETATAMTAAVVRALPCAQFLALLSQEGLLSGFIHYLATRIADQQETIANLLTVESEQRLGKTLLQLARKLGKPDPRSIRIEQRITHEELAAMVGTTRPRISTFMCHFRELGLIEISAERFLIIKELKLSAYLAQCTSVGALHA